MPVLSMVYGVRLITARVARGVFEALTIVPLTFIFVSGSCYSHFDGVVYSLATLSAVHLDGCALCARYRVIASVFVAVRGT